MSSLTGLKRADGQRVSLLLGGILGGTTLLLNAIARRPNRFTRAIIDTTLPLVAGRAAEGVTRRPLTVDGAGTQLDAALYTPSVPTDGLLVLLHGGGYVIGGLRSHGPTAAFTAEHGRCQVLAVAYRKAPEHRFPAALEDAVAAYRWAVANAATLGADPARIAVGGDSAGGQLAAALCLELDPGEPRPKFAWLIYPLVDGDINGWPSAWTFERGPLLSRRNANDMVSHYATGPHQLLDRRLTILHAGNLEQMPPTYIATAGMDPIRDQGEAFAPKLRAAGVEVELRRFDNMPHGFDLLLIDPGAREATRQTCEALARGLS